MDGDRATHVLVPVDVYEDMLKASMVESAVATLDDPDSKWVDADAFGRKLAGEQVAKARRAKGMTQTELGAKLGIPQSQISRIERNPDHTTLRTLKRVAKALGVDVRALV